MILAGCRVFPSAGRLSMLRSGSLCYRAALYATERPSMLQSGSLCYREVLYATERFSMLQSDSLCYRVALYATERPSRLQSGPLCCRATLNATERSSMLQRGLHLTAVCLPSISELNGILCLQSASCRHCRHQVTPCFQCCGWGSQRSSNWSALVLINP